MDGDDASGEPGTPGQIFIQLISRNFLVPSSKKDARGREFLSAVRPKAVVFGLENVLIGRPPLCDAGGERILNTRWDLLHRMKVDPKNDPLVSLLKGDPEALPQSSQILKPLLSGEVDQGFSQGDLGAYLYQKCLGSSEVGKAIRSVRHAKLDVVIWDNSITGTTDHLHQLIDHFYPGFFSKGERFFSSECLSLIGEEFFLKILLDHLEVSEKEILLVTSNYGYRDYALRNGIKTCFFQLFGEKEGPNPLLFSLIDHLQILGPEGTMPEGCFFTPLMYQEALNEEVWPPLQRLTELTSDRAQLNASESAKLKVLNDIAGVLTGPLQPPTLRADLLCSWIDRVISNGTSKVPPLSDELIQLKEDEWRYSPLPSFKSVKEVRKDAMKLVDGYHREIERAIPSLAQASFQGLLEEFESLHDLDNEFLAETGVVSELAEKVREHLKNYEELYVEKTGLMDSGVWKVLVQIFTEDDEALDRHYAEWIDETNRLAEEMAVRKAPFQAIRKFVKGRLVGNLVLRIIDLEMRERCLKKKVPRPALFPQWHDAKSKLTGYVNKADKPSFWRGKTTSQPQGLKDWVYDIVVMGQSRRAKESATKLRFQHHQEIEASAKLDLLSKEERGHLDAILTELILNGIKYGKQDPESSFVLIEMTERAGEIQFRVSDNGIGIQDVEKIWEAGWRERPDLADGEGGGLFSIMKHVKEHGWSIEVQPTPGGGSTFILIIPIPPGNP